MSLINCPECGRMYIRNSFDMCESCKASEEAGFTAIKEYIEENNSCTLVELTDATGVSIKKILGYIREGRLVATSGMAGEVTCKSCQEPVLSGNFCEQCARKFNENIKDLYKDKDMKESVPKMGIKQTGIKMKIKDKL